MNDGYSFTATYTPSDIIYTVSNIVTVNETGAEPAGATSFSFSLSDAVAADPSLSSALDDYVASYSSLVGDSFAYFSHQNSSGGTATTFGNFEIAVTTTGAILLGDVNTDDVVNFLDISPFIAILSAGDFQAEADVNQDGIVNFLDIAPFIGILSGSP